jgi:peptidoglycan-associated lipoprotein
MNAPSMRLAALLCALLCACSGRSPRRGAPRDGAAAKGGSQSLQGADAEAVEASLRGKRFQTTSALKTVLFDYDASRLTDEARARLKENAAWLRQNPRVEIQIQGHCDERGTTPYNLALGQRRARAVRDYYRELGVPSSRMSTISFGEEAPSCSRSDEECWSANRRAETLARVDESPRRKR